MWFGSGAASLQPDLSRPAGVKMRRQRPVHAAIGSEPQLNLDVILADVIKHARTAPIALPDAEALEAV
jgi:hypothetical protein